MIPPKLSSHCKEAVETPLPGAAVGARRRQWQCASRVGGARGSRSRAQGGAGARAGRSRAGGPSGGDHAGGRGRAVQAGGVGPLPAPTRGLRRNPAPHHRSGAMRLRRRHPRGAARYVSPPSLSLSHSLTLSLSLSLSLTLSLSLSLSLSHSLSLSLRLLQRRRRALGPTSCCRTRGCWCCTRRRCRRRAGTSGATRTGACAWRRCCCRR